MDHYLRDTSDSNVGGGGYKVSVRRSFANDLISLHNEFGNWRQALELFYNINPSRSVHRLSPDISDVYGLAYSVADAKAFIDSILNGETRIAVINEYHFVPEHRSFIISMLPVFKDHGFTHFACESISPDRFAQYPSSLPDSRWGREVEEPTYYKMLCKAIELGFKLVPYEFIPGEKLAGMKTEGKAYPQQREEGQAIKVLNQTLKTGPDSKVLVFCGQNHSCENNHSAGITMMARWLKQLSGLDPLTISQADCIQKPEGKGELLIYQFVCDALKITGPVVLTDPSGRATNPPAEEGGCSRSDLMVIHPRTSERSGRPEWLWKVPETIEYVVTTKKKENVGFIRALKKDSGPNATAWDQVRCSPLAHKHSLALQAQSEFIIHLYSPAGELVRTKTIRVKSKPL